MTKEYNGIVFELRPFNIKTKEAYTQIVLTIDRIYKSLIKAREIDISLLDKYTYRLNELQTAFSQLRALENLNEDQKTQLENLEKSLNDLKATMINDKEYQETLNEVNTCYTEATLKVCQSIELIKPFMESVLIGDLTKLDWETDFFIDEFCAEVLKVFFSYAMSNKRK